MTIRRVPITVRQESLEGDMKKVLADLRPEWPTDRVKVSELYGGFINAMYKCWLEGDSDAGNVVIMRVFSFKMNPELLNKSLQASVEEGLEGCDELLASCEANNIPLELESKDEKVNADEKNEKNEKKEANGEAHVETKVNAEKIKGDTSLETMFFNRMNEGEVMHQLNQHGLCSPVYGRFENGLCYGYADGETLTMKVMRSDAFVKEFSGKLALLHTLTVPAQPGNPYKTMHDKMRFTFEPFMKMALKQVEGDMRNSGLERYNQYLALDELNLKCKNLEDILDKIGWGEITFCHNDLNRNNAIWNEQSERLTFIDFELAMPNYTCYDWAVHFVSHSGHFLENFDIADLPPAHFRLKVLRLYLIERRRIEGEPVEDGDASKFHKDLWTLHRRVSIHMGIFFLRLAVMSPIFQFNTQMFNNPQLKQRLKVDPNVCANFGLQSYDGYLKMNEEILVLKDQAEPPSDLF
jgi:thiamine kinase-like enzyme